MASGDFDFAPMGFWSELMERDVVLLHKQFQIPPMFQLEIPEPNDRVCHPPPSRMSLYKKYFGTGLRLPLHLFFIALLQYLGMSPYLVVLNSWQHICGFIVVCVLAGIDHSIALFRSFFTLKWYLGSHGWWYVTPRKKKDICPLIQDASSAVYG